MSLNLASRIAEHEAIDNGRLDRENARRAARGLAAVTTIEELDLPSNPKRSCCSKRREVVAEMVAVEHPAKPQFVERLGERGAAIAE